LPELLLSKGQCASRSRGGTIGSISSLLGCIGCSSHFAPLQSSIIGIETHGQKSKSGDDGSYPKSVGFVGLFAAFCFGLAGFGLIYSTGSVKEKPIFGVFNVPVAVGFLFASWISLHASLDILNFGRIYWEHLL
jgi:hypothetical protein